MSDRLPDGWSRHTVEEVCRIVNNNRKPISEAERRKIAGTYPYYGPTGILGYINEYAFDGIFALIGEDGDHFFKYASKPMTQLVRGKFNVNNHAHIISGTHQCSPEWFYIFFLNRDITSNITRQGAKRFKLTKEALCKLLINIPPVSEQQKIACILTTWDAAITCTQKLLENSKQQKKALMQQMLTGRRRLPGFNGEWRQQSIQSFSQNSSKKNIKCEQLPVLSCSKHYGFIDSLEYFKKKVFSNDLSTYKIICRGEFGYPANHIEEGAIGCQNKYSRALVSPIYIVFKLNKQVDANFVYSILKTDSYRQKFSTATSASVDRRGSLRWSEFSKIKIFLPPLDEQKAIAKILNAADALIAQYEARLAHLQMQKKALMQLLLTGKIRVMPDTLGNAGATPA